MLLVFLVAACLGGRALGQRDEIFIHGEETARNVTKVLNVWNGAHFGEWTEAEFCPIGSYAVGYDIKLENNQFLGDDTSLNGIQLICSDEAGDHFGDVVTSGVSGWGEWKGHVSCNQRPGKSMFLTEFSLQVEDPQHDSDDTAANWIKFKCRDVRNKTDVEELNKEPGKFFAGDYGEWSELCDVGSAICGLITNLQEPQGDEDDTALNDVKFYCCALNEPMPDPDTGVLGK